MFYDRFVCLTVLFTYLCLFITSLLTLLYKCHLLIKCFIISPARRCNNVCIRFPFSYGTTCNLHLFFFFFVKCVSRPFSGTRLLSHFLICVFSQFCYIFQFCKNISTTICWVVSGNCLFFFFVCLLLLSYVFECFTVSTSSMALFAQHQSLLFFFHLLLWVCVRFSNFHILLSHSFCLLLFFYCS